MTDSGTLTVLVAPLDWGLGHSTRCIPVIKTLVEKGFNVILTGSASQKILLGEEFPALEFVDLPGYMVHYGSKRERFALNIFFQVPKILIQIKRERRWLSEFRSSRKLDIVISDNRFGLAVPGLYSVFITHQLHIRTGFGNFFSRLMTNVNFKFINKFSICWVPDNENDFSLAGELSHPRKLPAIPTRYIGPLTRFEKSETEFVKDSVVVILSGPEPQRTLFERKIFSQIGRYDGKLTIVRGLPGSGKIPDVPRHVAIFNHLPATELNKLIEESEFVISRSGYSTIMDIAALGKKGILIPTPGQPEQEYLANYLSAKKIIFSVREEDFDLNTCIANAKKFPFQLYEGNDSRLEYAIDELKIEAVR